MQQINLQFTYTETDFSEFLWDYVIKGRGKRMLWWLVIAVLLLGATLWQQGRLNLLMIGGIVAVFGFFAFMWRLLLLQSAKKTFRMNLQMQEPRHCLVSAVGLTMKGETFTSEYKWSDALRFAETPNLFLLYTSAMSALMLPKRAFTTEQTAEFRQILVDNHL